MTRLAKPIIALFIVALISIAMLGLNSRMMADDYCFALNGVMGNPWDNVVGMYYSWSGTYSEVFFKSMVAPFQRIMQPLATSIFMFFFFGASVCLFQQIFATLRLTVSHGLIFILAGLLVFLGMNGTASRQNLYWFALLFDYNTPIILIIFYSACLIWLFRQKRSPLAIRGVTCVTAICVFIASGMSEVYASGQIVGLIFVGGLCFWRLPQQRSKVAWVFGLALLVAGIALAIILGSPGNALREALIVRINGYTRPPLLAITIPSLIYTIHYSFIETYGLAHRAIALVATLFVFAWLFPREQLAQLPTTPYPFLLALVAGIIGFMVMGLLCAPSYYGVGDVVPRTVFAGHIFWVGVFMLWGYLIAVGLARYKSLNYLLERPLFILTRAVLVGLLVFFPVAIIVYHLNIAPDLIAYAQDWDTRDSYLIAQVQTGNTGDMLVEPFRYNLEDYLALEPIVLSGESTWVGNCANQFYGVSNIVEKMPDMPN